MKHLTYTASLFALIAAATPAAAQDTTQTTQQGENVQDEGEIVVTATLRAQRLQDVPLSVTAYSQEELTQKGIIGFEGIARETPGVALNKATDNNARFTTRGISTNGWNAGLQNTTTVYLNELPLTTIGNSITLDTAMYDVERVEFLRGPQGTLFGSGSLSGAMRILTRSPDLNSFAVSGMADLGWTQDANSFRQRYNAMVNVPIADGVAGLRFVGFYRNEEGYIDNVGTGVKNSNTLKGYGGRLIFLARPTDRFSVRLMAMYEDSGPEDASLTTPALGDRKRSSYRPDRYTSQTEVYNATLEYDFDWARLTSSTTFSVNTGDFDVDLAGTFGPTLPIPFLMDINYETQSLVQETRLVSVSDGGLDWVIGGFYLQRDLDTFRQDRTTPAFTTALGITGLTDSVFAQYSNNARNYELAGFGELTYNFTSKFAISGGVRYGKYGSTTRTLGNSFGTNYFTRALYPAFFPNPSAAQITPTAPASFTAPTAAKASWKGSVTWRPSRDLTLYGSVSTGYRTPVYNARAGSVSLVNPNDLVIPQGATSDNLVNYEVGLKGSFFDRRLTMALAAYYIDWTNIQVQANRVSDSVQFATNIGGAYSQGIEAEIRFVPVTGLTFGLNGSVNKAHVNKITAQEAQISGAVPGVRLSSPGVQGSFYGSYNYSLGGGNSGFSSFQIQHVGSFPNMFPNTPGTAGTPSPLAGFTDAYTYINLQTGVTLGKVNITAYVENLGNTRKTTYIHPEAFVYSRHGILRPRTFGVRLGFNL